MDLGVAFIRHSRAAKTVAGPAVLQCGNARILYRKLAVYVDR